MKYCRWRAWHLSWEIIIIIKTAWTDSVDWTKLVLLSKLHWCTLGKHCNGTLVGPWSCHSCRTVMTSLGCTACSQLECVWWEAELIYAITVTQRCYSLHVWVPTLCKVSPWTAWRPSGTFVFWAQCWQLCSIARPEQVQPACWPQWEAWDVSIMAAIGCLALPFNYWNPVRIASRILCWQTAKLNWSSHSFPKRKFWTGTIKPRIVTCLWGLAARLMSERWNEEHTVSPGRLFLS